MREADGTALGDLVGDGVEDILLMVLRPRMVDAVHAEGVGSVVEGVIDVEACALDAGGTTAATGEEVEDEFFLEVAHECGFPSTFGN